MQNTHKSRLVALSTAAILTTMALVPAAPAHAADSKSYKYGAIGLGILGAVLLSKGKTLEGAAALGGGYLAYKKSGQDRNKELRDNRRDNRRYNKYDNNYNNGNYGNNYSYNNADNRPIYPDANNSRYNNSNNDNDRDNDNRRDNNNRNNNYKWDR